MRVTRREGEILPPWYYGIAYVDWVSDHTVFYPIPLNLLVRYGRLLEWWWNKKRGRETYHLLTKDDLNQIRKEEYERGRWAERRYQDEQDNDARQYIGRIMEIT